MSPQTNSTANRIWLESRAEPDQVTLMRSSAGSSSGPRMMELWLRLSNVTAVAHSEAGSALRSAGKDLIVQDKGDGLYRVLAFSSSNTSTIGAGELATLELERDGDGPIRAELLTDRPMFAPQETQEGLRVGDPIEL